MRDAREALDKLIGFSAQRREAAQELAHLVLAGKGDSPKALKLANKVAIVPAPKQQRGRKAKRGAA